MNIKRYFLFIKRKINKFDAYITNSKEYGDMMNPFLPPPPKTYVWIDETNPEY